MRTADLYGGLRTRYGSTTVPGTGRRVAIIDTGIDLTHPEIAPAAAAGRVSCTPLGRGQCAPPVSPDAHHGTAVSSLILAQPHATRPSTFSFHGIAYGADVDVYAIALGSGGGPYNPSPPTAGTMRGHADDFKGYLDQGLGGTRPDVVNMSFGAPGITEEYLPHRSSMAGWLSPLISTVRGATNTVFVIAAGNGHGRRCQDSSPAGCGTGRLDASSPSFDAALPVWDPTGQVGRRWVAVVATDSDNRIARFSNRCGLAAKWCLAAPSQGVEVAYSGANPLDPLDSNLWHGYGLAANGTSYAAPLVSGGLVLVKQYFGNTLSMEQVLQRVYATADVVPDTVPGGEACPAHLNTDSDPQCELSSVYGRGVMNLQRATLPLGRTRGHGTFPHNAAASTLLARGIHPVVFDSLGFPFRTRPGEQARFHVPGVNPIPSGPVGRDAGEPAWPGLQWFQADPAGAGPWSFATARDGAGTATSGGFAYRSRSPGAGAFWQAGLVSERNHVHGGAATGTWLGGGFWHHTTFLRAGKRWDLTPGRPDGFALEASSTLAHGAMRGNGVLRETNGVYTGHALHLAHTAPGRETRLSLSAPLRAETGSFTLKVPVGGTLHDGVRYADVEGDLAPAARELRLNGAHTSDLPVGQLTAGLGLRMNAGHIEDHRDWYGGLRYSVAF